MRSWHVANVATSTNRNLELLLPGSAGKKISDWTALNVTDTKFTLHFVNYKFFLKGTLLFNMSTWKKSTRFRKLSGESVYGMEKVAYVLNINHTDLRGRQVDAEGLLPIWHKLTARSEGQLQQSLTIWEFLSWFTARKVKLKVFIPGGNCQGQSR